MKKILLLLLLYGIILNTFAQNELKDTYIIDLSSDQKCEILFYSNAKYQISILNIVSRTMTEETVLSCGTYTKKGNLIILHDSYIGLKMQCERSNSYELKFVQGFTFLLHKIFKLCGITYAPEETIPSNYSSIRIKQARENYKKSHPNKYVLYYSQYSNGDYVLDIQKEYKYVLRYSHLIISEGIWKKEGNEILLFDNSLQYTFIILIGPKGLMGKYLPGNFNNLILYEKNYPFKEEIVTIHSTTHKGLIVTETIKPDGPFMHIEEMPQFPNGGEKAMLAFIKQNTHYPESAQKAGIKGRVILRIVIEKDGSIHSINVAKKLSPECDTEAIRVIKSMPQWIPGKHHGVNVAVQYTIAVDFGVK